jgi:mannose-6-phosphate isomerase-like protein (cupin superfamily)/glycosyltransferase A (GT-A) superfamily protein (DUF2064 family)
MEVRKRDEARPFTAKDGSTIREIFHPHHTGAKNQSFAEATVAPGEKTREHHHAESEEIYYLLKGRGRVSVGGEVREVGPSTAVLIPPGTKHSIENSGTEDLVFLCSSVPTYRDEDMHLSGGDVGKAMEKDALLLFARAPVAGTVKTRLRGGLDLTDGEILDLYTAFLKDTLLTALRSSAGRIYLTYTPPEAYPALRPLLEEVGGGKIETFPQEGEDFDTRFTLAVQRVSRENRGGSMVIVGSDSPLLSPSLIDRAFAHLRGRGGLVLGPSREGGAYLIGLRADDPPDFTGVFSQGNELENLLEIAERRDLPVHLLEEMTDVDLPQDLITLVSNLKVLRYVARHGEVHLPPNTLETVERLGLRVVRSRGNTREKRLVKEGGTWK